MRLNQLFMYLLMFVCVLAGIYASFEFLNSPEVYTKTYLAHNNTHKAYYSILNDIVTTLKYNLILYLIFIYIKLYVACFQCVRLNNIGRLINSSLCMK